jgi:hypothetical protein
VLGVLIETGQQRSRVHRQDEGRREQAFLVAEVVMDEGWVDVGSGGHRPHRGAFESELGEQLAGRGEDLISGIGAAGGTSPARWH